MRVSAILKIDYNPKLSYSSTRPSEMAYFFSKPGISSPWLMLSKRGTVKLVVKHTTTKSTNPIPNKSMAVRIPSGLRTTRGCVHIFLVKVAHSLSSSNFLLLLTSSSLKKAHRLLSATTFLPTFLQRYNQTDAKNFCLRVRSCSVPASNCR